MQRIRTALFLLILTAVWHSPSSAVTISLDPSTQTVGTGSAVSVGLDISGLGDGTALSLGSFDIDILYNPLVLTFDSATFGDPGLGNQLDLFGFGTINDAGLLGSGVLNVFELSFDLPEDLDDFQAPAFRLATLNFTALLPGTTSLTLDVFELGDADGLAITDFTTEDASVTVGAPSTTVPEPSAAVLLLAGLAGIAALRKRRTQA